jgi:AraC-like DNA-binding protein
MKNSVLLVDSSFQIREQIKGVFANKYHLIEAEALDNCYHHLSQSIPDMIILGVSVTTEIIKKELSHISKIANEYKSVIILVIAEQFCEKTLSSVLKSGAHDYYVHNTSHNLLSLKVDGLINYKNVLFQAQREAPSVTTGELQNSEMENKLKTFEQLIDENIKNDVDFDVNNIAVEMNLSLRTFERAVKKGFNMTPVRYIMKKRLEKATVLLNTGQISIKDIAYQTGFNSVAYFSKCFKNFYGYSPSIVKRKHINI